MTTDTTTPEEIKEESIETSLDDFQEAIKHDCCPTCGTPTTHFQWITRDLMALYGATDCPNCGTLFVPLSIRKLKMDSIQKTIKVPPLIVTPE